jgi:type I restriction enzyme M protein
MSEEQKKILERQLWCVANALRGKMNADEYKNYILGFIFYKYLSERLESYVNAKLLSRDDEPNFSEIKENTKEGQDYLEHIKIACIGHLGFFLKPTETFSYLVKKGKGEIQNQTIFILEDLKNILNSIEKTSAGTASEDDFKGLFDDMDLTSTKLGSRESEKNEVVIEVLTLLSGIDFKLEDSKSDLLGDAYEYLIGAFAAGSGKKGGEFYTPAQVSRLLAKIVSADRKRVKTAYDPTCGSGSLLLRLNEFTEVSDYYGQELNPTTYNLGRMNMILHGVHFDKFSILHGNTLTEDMHPDLKAEVIVANPPFAIKWKGDTDPALVHDDRFSQYGRLAPKNAADYAFVTHMLYHLADNGTMAIVLPHGALFRSGAEGHIRKYIVEKQNYLDAVIGLPSNLFYGTSIPATVLVFKKCRKDDDDILFIDASKEFEKGKNQNKLTNENIDKIFDTYHNREEKEKYSHRAGLQEIKDNDFNLNIPRYVDTFKEEEKIDIEEVATKLKQLHKDEVGLQGNIAKFCEELGIKIPF